MATAKERRVAIAKDVIENEGKFVPAKAFTPAEKKFHRSKIDWNFMS